MFESEDGYLTGSIDVSKLDEAKPKSDEAKAQIEALKAERDAGQRQADADADRVAELHEKQAAQLRGEDASKAAEDKAAKDKAAADKAKESKDSSRSGRQG